MNVAIERSEIEGKIKAPPSKSYTHRALICSSLAKGKSKIIHPLDCEDTKATFEALQKIGVEIKKREKFWEVNGGNLKEPTEEIFCKGSGTTFRFMIALCSLFSKECKITGNLGLVKRPIKPLLQALKMLGVKSSLVNGGVVVKGPLKGGKAIIPGNISSQFISALLLVSPLAENLMKIQIKDKLESKPYVLMTIETQKKFGVRVNASKDLREFFIHKQNYKPQNYEVEGDWSSASFLLTMGALAGKIEVIGLNLKSLQADKRILEILKRMNANVKIRKKNIVVEKSQLNAINVNISDCPDLFPVICILSAAAKGKSEINGITRLKFKESNRVLAMKEGLIKMGVKVKKEETKFVIEGTEKINGARIDPKNDHRIAMAFGVLGLISERKTIIENAECVSKSFPDFWGVLRKIGGGINEQFNG
jgi:3-phosphoshikimate 1-carboxyvinyltransferase